MTTTTPTTTTDARSVTTDLWVERRGEGPDVLLIAGLGDPVEAWAAQLDGLADRYRLTAFDNRGVGRSPALIEDATVADMADDAAQVLRSLDVTAAHVAGFSGGGAIAQELALRHPELVRSLVLVGTWACADAYFSTLVRHWRSLLNAPDLRSLLESFFLWVYSRRAHDDGTVEAAIADALGFPHPQSAEGFLAQLAAFEAHDTLDRLGEITVPTLTVTGDEDLIAPPALARAMTDRIPGAELVILPGEAHQPFQEQPDRFNELVHRFWAEVDAGQR